MLWCTVKSSGETICFRSAENKRALEITFKFICRDLDIQNYFQQSISNILIISNFPS